MRRLLTAALACALGTASPASALAHALAHHRDVTHAHHVASPVAREGPAAVSAHHHGGDHPHVRLDQATRCAPQDVVPGLPVTATDADPTVALCTRAVRIAALSVTAPDPPGDDPPRLRAPPIH